MKAVDGKENDTYFSHTDVKLILDLVKIETISTGLFRLMEYEGAGGLTEKKIIFIFISSGPFANFKTMHRIPTPYIFLWFLLTFLI